MTVYAVILFISVVLRMSLLFRNIMLPPHERSRIEHTRF